MLKKLKSIAAVLMVFATFVCAAQTSTVLRMDNFIDNKFMFSSHGTYYLVFKPGIFYLYVDGKILDSVEISDTSHKFNSTVYLGRSQKWGKTFVILAEDKVVVSWDTVYEGESYKLALMFNQYYAYKWMVNE